MDRIAKLSLILVGIAILSFLAYWTYVFIVFFEVFTPQYSKQDLIENFKNKNKKIYEVEIYAKSIIPTDKSIHLEFESNSQLSIFHISDKNGQTNYWNIALNSKNADSLLHELGWTKQTLSLLKEKLDNANCISIQSGEPFTIGYQRNGMGMYFYNLFDKPMTDSTKNDYNNGCTNVVYNEKVAFEYGGGAIGMQCFEDFERKSN